MRNRRVQSSQQGELKGMVQRTRIRNSAGPRRVERRRGLTLAELLVATTIMLLIATAVATLASTVQTTNTFCQGYTVSAQHARVALSRIQHTVESATASEQFPGFIV